VLIDVAIDSVERAEADQVLEILRQLELEEAPAQKMIGQRRVAGEIGAFDGKELDRHAWQLDFGRGLGGRRALRGIRLDNADNRGGRPSGVGDVLETLLGIDSAMRPRGIFRGLRLVQEFAKRFSGLFHSQEIKTRKPEVVKSPGFEDWIAVVLSN